MGAELVLPPFATQDDPRAAFDVWSLEFLWSLAIGIWRFSTPGYSIENGEEPN
jgi:hypothetical protein